MSGSSSALANVVGTWGAPPDLAAKLAVLVAIFAIGFGFVRRSPLLHDGHERRFLAIVSVAAAVLSIAYVSSYLHGGPRIIDATSYFLQGRALSHGDFAWTPLDPSSSFRGRFLIYRDGAEPTLGGIFPPGYPLLLAPAFWLGAPMVVGPAIAAGLVVATYRLARAMGLAEPHARAAALLSMICAALRYHTADTMSHGATALGIALALECALRGRAVLAWLAVGYVVATRPVSAVPIALVVGALVLRSRPRAIAGMLPGVVLLLVSQRAVTGSFFASAQRMYYALSDGPTGCFRYGFGADTGCVFEHGDFVASRLGGGFGVAQAIGTTVRRLHHHLLDVANFEPLVLLSIVAIVKERRARVGAGLLGLHVLAYLPFYFDGDYPGGGARLFADVLPIQHVLVVMGVAALASEARADRALHVLLGASLAGFAFHASFEHGKLRDRDAGRPWFERELLGYASIKQGLVFIDSDHGFALGHDPGQKIETGVVVARRRGDDRDRLLYESLGRPPTFWYRFDPSAKEATAREPHTTPWAPPAFGDVLRFEAEAEWPALAQAGGFAAPGWSVECASGRRALVVTPDDGGTKATVTVLLPVPGRVPVEERGRGPAPEADPTTPAPREWELTIAVSHAELPHATVRNRRPARGSLTVATNDGDVLVSWEDPKDCATLPGQVVRLRAPSARVTITAEGGPVGVDAMYLRRLPSP